MDSQKLDMYIMTNQKYFPTEKIHKKNAVKNAARNDKNENRCDSISSHFLV